MNIAPEELWALIVAATNGVLEANIDNGEELSAEVQVLRRLNDKQAVDLVALRYKLNDAEGHRDTLGERLTEVELVRDGLDADLRQAGEALGTRNRQYDELAEQLAAQNAELCRIRQDKADNDTYRLEIEKRLRAELESTQNDLAGERRKSVHLRLVARERDIALKQLTDIASNIENGGLSEDHLIDSIKGILEREA